MSRRPLLKLTDVNLVFQTSIYRAWTWRDVFVKTLREPSSLLPNPRDRLHVCKDVSFELYPGDRVALIGVNGVGKTSLCRCIAGFYKQTSGHIERHGFIRALFDVTVAILPELTGRENAWLLAELLYPGDRAIGDAIEEALRFSELGEFLDVPFRIYSKGMQARLGLALATMRPAEILILDEVFDGADAFFAEKMARRTIQMMQDSGAVIFVSHGNDQIRRVCNRVLLLEEGRLVFDGGVEEGLARYASHAPPQPVEREREAQL